MAAAQSRISVNFAGVLESVVDIGTVRHNVDYGATYNLIDGTGADSIKEIFADSRTLAASATENMDMAGVLTDAFGTTITFTKIKAICIKASSANTNDVVVGGHGSAACFSMFNAATDKIKVKPGGMMLLVAPDNTGYAVTATTADMITVANSSSGTGVTYDVIIMGVV